MAANIRRAFAAARDQNRAAFVTFITAGYPRAELTPSLLLALQCGGADIIELGIPFTDPLADGPTIQMASEAALSQGVDMDVCLAMVRAARALGVTVPIVFMGYYNPVLAYGDELLMKKCVDAGIDGFIIVDLPPEESVRFRTLCKDHGRSYIPLVAPSTTDARIKQLVGVADSFIYVLSKMGVTGASTSMNAELPALISRIRQYTEQPLAVGFGVSNNAHFQTVRTAGADGVVVGSKIITIARDVMDKPNEVVCETVRKFCAETCGYQDNAFKSAIVSNTIPEAIATGSGVLMNDEDVHRLPTRFGEFGGQYVPEALVDCLSELEDAYISARTDPAFWEEFRGYFDFIGRPSSLHKAERLTAYAGGARIWLKREDLNHTGSHKINNAVGQILLAKRLGKTRIIAETGAGQHGVATATVCAKFGFECIVYMGAEDVRRQALNVFRMRLLGATVVPVTSGSKTLKDAVNEAMRDWVTNVTTTHYLVGSAIGPHPFPTIVRDFQAVIGQEAREQMLKQAGKLPDLVIACVGGGSNSIGIFHPFIDDKQVALMGVEAGGDGIDTDRHSATLAAGTPGVFHGARTYLLQDDKGQIRETHSISAGLDYPGVGPEHAWLKATGRATYVAVADRESLIGFRRTSELEGIIPALETSHALYMALEVAKDLKADQDILVCVSGRGDKDVHSVAEALPKFGPELGWDLRFE